MTSPTLSVQLLAIELDQPDDVVTRFAASLDPYERDAAATRAAGLVRNRYVAAHGAVREIIGVTIAADPSVVRFDRACTHCGHPSHGKPRVETEVDCSFSLSHSGPIAVVAVATDGSAIGVDIEIRKPRRHLERLAARVLTTDEHHEWQSLPPDERLDVFLRMWTAKEAFLKAVGRGLVESMRAVPRQPAGWTVADFVPVSGVFGALAMEGTGRTAPEVAPWTPALGVTLDRAW